MQALQHNLKGIEDLLPQERTYLLLLGELANDLTSLAKLMSVVDRNVAHPCDEEAAASVLLGAEMVRKAVVLRLLGARIWQAWGLLDSTNDGRFLGKSQWYREKRALHEKIKTLRRHFKDGTVWDRIRNQFAYHYDADALDRTHSGGAPGNSFEWITSDKIVDSFFVSSEVTVWSSILGAKTDEEFLENYESLCREAVDRVFDLLGVMRDLVVAFVEHLEAVRKNAHEVIAVQAIPLTGSHDVTWPLFFACSDSPN